MVMFCSFALKDSKSMSSSVSIFANFSNCITSLVKRVTGLMLASLPNEALSLNLYVSQSFRKRSVHKYNAC
ncbi:unnamed protein product [Cuscuta europaea]|uniref:Uncharacterized protein n=1 Tax=Cuscuta europaea TaxID=41803 RepID=A0A9P0ZBY8_CUSEU|nr:unnamed protein product [Cuscuta europaea]